VQNDFGAALGGPLAGKKTFFFANYEGFRNVRAVTNNRYRAHGGRKRREISAGPVWNIYNPFSQRANPKLRPHQAGQQVEPGRSSVTRSRTM